MSIPEPGIKSKVKQNAGKTPENGTQKVKFNSDSTLHLFNVGDGVTLAFIAKNDVNEEKLGRLKEDLQKDLLLICRGNLSTLQDAEMNDGHYQRQLEPKMESRINAYRTLIKSNKVKEAQ